MKYLSCPKLKRKKDDDDVDDESSRRNSRWIWSGRKCPQEAGARMGLVDEYQRKVRLEITEALNWKEVKCISSHTT